MVTPSKQLLNMEYIIYRRPFYSLISRGLETNGIIKQSLIHSFFIKVIFTKSSMFPITLCKRLNDINVSYGMTRLVTNIAFLYFFLS